jgi:transcriptional regulator with XRE-family HTH domain
MTLKMFKARIARLRKKGFRDAYVRSHLTHGLAHQIRALRNQRGWSQKDLAEKLGLKGQSAIARMEDPGYGRLSIATLLKLSSIFDVALSVRFVSYGKFLSEREDLSPRALSAESFDVEVPKIMEDIERVTHYLPVRPEPSTASDLYHRTTSSSHMISNYKVITDIKAGE